MDGETVPPGIDTTRAHPARVYDYWLGGKDNFAADREAAEQALQAYPQLAQAVQANRKFLARAVRYLTGEAGIRQFLDVGTGIPAAESIKRYNERVADQATLRDQAGTARFFAGLDLVEPGVVPVASWRPDSDYLASMPS